MTNYLTMVEVLAIHQDQIERYGGSHGLRDAGALEAALYRPQSGYYKNTIEAAAALWESLSQNHPFIDENKRTAFASVYTFLSINGLRIKSGSDDLYSFLEGLYENNDFNFKKLVVWLQKHTVTH